MKLKKCVSSINYRGMRGKVHLQNHPIKFYNYELNRKWIKNKLMNEEEYKLKIKIGILSVLNDTIWEKLDILCKRKRKREDDEK